MRIVDQVGSGDPFVERVVEIPVAPHAVVIVREAGRPDRVLAPGERVTIATPPDREFYSRAIAGGPQR